MVEPFAVSRIAMVTRDRQLVDELGHRLREEGFSVIRLSPGARAVGVAKRENPDLVLVDAEPMEIGGAEFCRRLRRESSVPIMVFAEREDEGDRTLVLDLGADDCVPKWCPTREVLARIKAILRRSAVGEGVAAAGASGAGARPLQIGALAIDMSRREALWEGRPLPIRPTEFDLLLFFARNPNVVVSRAMLLERVWGYSAPADSGTVAVYIRWLREKIESDPSRPTHLLTVRGLGYRFVP